MVKMETGDPPSIHTVLLLPIICNQRWAPTTFKSVIGVDWMNITNIFQNYPSPMSVVSVPTYSPIRQSCPVVSFGRLSTLDCQIPASSSPGSFPLILVSYVWSFFPCRYVWTENAGYSLSGHLATGLGVRLGWSQLEHPGQSCFLPRCFVFSLGKDPLPYLFLLDPPDSFLFGIPPAIRTKLLIPSS